MIRDIWRARGLVWELVKRDLRGRYAGSTLGMTWAIIQPLVMISMYTLVFSSLPQKVPGGDDTSLGEPWSFIVRLCIGIFVWNLFQECTNRGTNTFIENANLIKKVAFPEGILPVVIIASALIRFAIEIFLYTLLLAGLGHFPGWLLLAVPIIMVLQVLFTFGLCLLLATVNVFFRDMCHIVSVGLFVLFWMIPIVAPQEIYPLWYQRTLLRVIPMHYVIAMWRNIYWRHVMPGIESFVVFGIMAAVTLLLGVTVYRRFYREIPDFI